MKAKNVILCGVSLISSSLLGSPFGSKVDEALNTAYEGFSNLETNLNDELIGLTQTHLKNVLTELEKLEKNVNDCEVECQIIGIKDDLDFLDDVKQYMNSASPELKEKLEIWADNSFKLVPIVQEAFKQKGVVIY